MTGLADKVLGYYQFSTAQGDAVNWAGMSPMGTWVVMGGDVLNGLDGGITIADKGIQAVLRWSAKVIGHCDVGLDTPGQRSLGGPKFPDRLHRPDSAGPEHQAGVQPRGLSHNTSAIRLVRLYYASESPVGLRQRRPYFGWFS